MTNQEVFDTVVTKLRAQGRRSIGEGGCMYRGSEGLKCAVGHLIPDDLYTPEMEAFSADVNPVKSVLEGLGVYIKLANQLQIIHDIFRVGQWEEGWRNLAEETGLTYTPPTEAQP